MGSIFYKGSIKFEFCEEYKAVKVCLDDHVLDLITGVTKKDWNNVKKRDEIVERAYEDLLHAATQFLDAERTLSETV